MTKKHWLSTVILLLSFLLTHVAFAQGNVIKGTVRSNEGTPLPGVTVSIKNTTNSSVTDEEGNFSITAAVGQVLQFTSVGYAVREVVVGRETSITVSMDQNQETLDDVVVVGYGQQRRGNLTGAVSTVNVDKTLTNRPIADVGRGLQGAAAGLSVVVPEGEVGSDPIIKIRGQIGSINGGSSPLILLDNVEIPSIQVVNPNDIASITVLKDAASASIYGAKAAFGVILITTKTGSGSSKPQIAYTNNFSFQNVWKDLKMADVNGLKYTVNAAERVGVTTPTGAFYYVNRASYERALEWKEKYGNTIGPNDPTVFGRDWYVQPGTAQKMGVRTYDPYDYMVKEWAPTQQHNLSVGMKSGKTSYNFGLGMLDQSGMVKPAKKDQFTRYNASLKLSSELSKHVTLRGSALYSRRNKEYGYATNSTTADPWLYIYRWGPLYPFGNDENGDPIRSPASELTDANTASILTNYMNFSGGGTVNITSNWKVDVDYTFTNNEEIWNRPGTRFTARDSWSAPVARNDANGNPIYVNNEGNVVNSSDPGAIRAYDLVMNPYTAPGANPDHIFRQATNLFTSTLNALTTYNLKLEQDHDFKFILGVNRVTRTSEWDWAQRTQLTNITNPQFPFAVGVQTNNGNKEWESQLGYFGRVNYAFQNKYLVEGNLRYDGASKFPTHLQWRWFPSVSAGWVISHENFMQSISSVVNFLKVRASWGSIGDQTVQNNLYVPRMTSTQSTWIGGTGARLMQLTTPASMDPNIQWQDVVSKNLGVDIGLWNGKVNVTFDVFERITKNMLVPFEGIPLTFGAAPSLGNDGGLSTKGWELTVDFNHRFKNGLGINLRGNISDAKTRLTSFGSGRTVTSNYNGKDIGEIWGYRTERLYQYDDFELDANGRPILITLTAAESALYAGRQAYRLKTVDGKKPVYQPFVQNSANFFFGPGDVKFKDLNGDGEINNGANSLDDYGDLTVIGNTNPRYEYGFRLAADYKGFDISAFFQGVGSRQIWGAGFLAIPGFNSADGAMPEAIAGNFWTPETPNAFYPAAYNNLGSGTTNNMQVQDRYLLNMAYLRLKNLTVGYTLPQKLASKAWISSFRVYIALENFITWDKLGDLPIDPESISGISMWNNGNYNLGRTASGVPAFKAASFGVQLNF